MEYEIKKGTLAQELVQSISYFPQWKVIRAWKVFLLAAFHFQAEGTLEALR